MPESRGSRSRGALRLKTALFTLAAALSACSAGEASPEPASEAPLGASRAALQTAGTAPVGLALEVIDGKGVPLRVRAGQPFYVNQLDIVAALTANRDEGVRGLTREGDFSRLPWGGVRLADEDFVPSPNPDGTFKRRRFFRDAAWMNLPSRFTVQPVDAQGRSVGRAVELHAGKNDRRRHSDTFFIRRMRAIQWTNDCPSLQSCTGADDFMEEALVELRNARDGEREVFTLPPRTASLRIDWSLSRSPYFVPVTQVEAPAFAYGFGMQITPLTPPGPGGFYAPGSDVTFQLTLEDGQGNRLHPQGELPTYNEVLFGENPSGIRYYRAFFDPSTTYYRRKHKEHMLMTQITGPAQKIQPVRTVVDISAFLDPNEDTIVIGTRARDGVYAEAMTLPPSNDLFGGAFDPTHAGWAAPVSDTWTYHLPADAEPGTYLVTLKGRRVFLGEDLPASKTIEIQVGSATPTEAKLTTGPCSSCHSQGGELSRVLHANDNRAACNACHAPLSFELEGPIFVRTHFIHSRSDRFDRPLEQCSSCHLNRESIQRTSKAACLSCHKSYPDSHVASFGPVESMYVGGGAESFQQCTGACHTQHPSSGL